jgi:mitochondrial fission protein ELM1
MVPAPGDIIVMQSPEVALQVKKEAESTKKGSWRNVVQVFTATSEKQQASTPQQRQPLAFCIGTRCKSRRCQDGAGAERET